MLIEILVELFRIIDWVETARNVDWNIGGVVRNNELGGNC